MKIKQLVSMSAFAAAMTFANLGSASEPVNYYDLAGVDPLVWGTLIPSIDASDDKIVQDAQPESREGQDRDWSNESP